MTAGQRRLDHVVAELGLALAAHLAVRVLELGDLRDQRALQPVGDRGPEHGAVGVVRLLAEEDEVGALALERGREHAAGGDEVRAGGGLVARRARRGRRPSRAPCASPRAPSPGPSETITTSPSPAASFSFSASSTAFASNGFSAPSPERSSRFVEGSMRRVGGRLRDVLGADGDLHAGRDSTERRTRALLALRPFEHDRSHMLSHRTTARGTLVLALALLTLAGGASAAAAAEDRLPGARHRHLQRRLRPAARGRAAPGDRHPRAQAKPRPRRRGGQGRVLDHAPRAPAACSTSTARAARPTTTST